MSRKLYTICSDGISYMDYPYSSAAWINRNQEYTISGSSSAPMPVSSKLCASAIGGKLPVCPHCHAGGQLSHICWACYKEF
jgi:hypothetical protein